MGRERLNWSVLPDYAGAFRALRMSADGHV